MFGERMKSLKKLIQRANELLNPDLSTKEGIKDYLKTWFVLKFNTTYKDPVLASHTLEELIVLYHVFYLKENPDDAERLINPDQFVSEEDAYEKWLQEQMGEDYVTEEQMVDDMVEYVKKEKELANQLPEKITTDFSMLGDEE